MMPAREFARIWESLPHLTPEEADLFETDIRAARASYTPEVDPLGTNEARRHAELWAHCASTIATLNVRRFWRVPGLRLVDVSRYLTPSAGRVAIPS